MGFDVLFVDGDRLLKIAGQEEGVRLLDEGVVEVLRLGVKPFHCFLLLHRLKLVN